MGRTASRTSSYLSEIVANLPDRVIAPALGYPGVRKVLDPESLDRLSADARKL